MISLVLVTEAQQTERTVTFLVFALLVVAVMLLASTIWYWRRTDPRRHAPVQRGYRQVEAMAYDDGYGRGGGYPVHDPSPTGQMPGHHPGADRWPPQGGRPQQGGYGPGQGGYGVQQGGYGVRQGGRAVGGYDQGWR